MATKRIPTGVVIRDRSIKIWFMYRGKRCWESLPLKPTTANIRHATKLREEICTRIAIGVFDYAEFFPNSKRAEETERSPSFREMAEAWLATVNQLSHSTLSRYRGMLNSHVLPKIGDMPIDRIQYSSLAGLLATLDCSAKTRNNIATVIRQPFVLALRDGRIKDNPAQHLANAKVQKEPPDPFTLEEAEAIHITPPETLTSDAVIDTYDDHRMAMCFSLASLLGIPVIINDPKCTHKTFPDYFQVFASLTN